MKDIGKYDIFKKFIKKEKRMNMKTTEELLY